MYFAEHSAFFFFFMHSHLTAFFQVTLYALLLTSNLATSPTVSNSIYLNMLTFYSEVLHVLIDTRCPLSVLYFDHLRGFLWKRSPDVLLVKLTNRLLLV